MQRTGRSIWIAFGLSLFGLLAAPSAVFAHADRGEQIQEVTLSMKRNPADAALWLRRGRLYLDEHGYTEALADLDRALQLEPNDLSPLMYKGQVLHRLGKYPEALACLDDYIRSGSPNSFAYELRAQVHESMNAPETALEDLRRAVELQTKRELSGGE